MVPCDKCSKLLLSRLQYERRIWEASYEAKRNASDLFMMCTPAQQQAYMLQQAYSSTHLEEEEEDERALSGVTDGGMEPPDCFTLIVNWIFVVSVAKQANLAQLEAGDIPKRWREGVGLA